MSSVSFGGYNFNFFPFMEAGKEEQPESEAYVVSPPALWILDKERARWTMGFMRPHRDPHRTGEYEFDVVRNGKPTGEYACRIEYKRGVVWIFGADGWRHWNGKTFI